MNISVVMAARNAGQTIQRALASVAGQTLPAHEIIVIDDGSSDDTSQRAQSTNLPLKVIRVEFGNAAASRNGGIREATGDWIAVLDADDAWYPTHLEIASSAVARSDDVAFLAAADYVDDTGAKVPVAITPLAHEVRSHLDEAAFISWFRQQSWFCNCTVLFQRAVFHAVGGFNESLIRRHDLDLFLRLIHGHTWTYSPIVGAEIQLGTPGSISQDRVSCDWYFLKALAELSSIYDSRDYRAILDNRARCALNSALAFGNGDDLKAAWEIAREHIALPRRLFYELAVHAPRVAGALCLRQAKATVKARTPLLAK